MLDSDCQTAYRVMLVIPTPWQGGVWKRKACGSAAKRLTMEASKAAETYALVVYSRVSHATSALCSYVPLL